MKKVMRRFMTKLILDEKGVSICRGIFVRRYKFLAWEEVKAIGFYVGNVRHMAYQMDAASYYPATSLNVQPYYALDLYLYFSVSKPAGFSRENIMPIFRNERNICINLGGGEFNAIRSIKCRAERAKQKIRTFYKGKIINDGVAYHK